MYRIIMMFSLIKLLLFSVEAVHYFSQKYSIDDEHSFPILQRRRRKKPSNKHKHNTKHIKLVESAATIIIKWINDYIHLL